MMRSILRTIIALVLVSASTLACAQTDNRGIGLAAAALAKSASQNSYTYLLLTNATAYPAVMPAAGGYVLNLPASFNGATITIKFVSTNGTVTTTAYTVAPGVAPTFNLFAGTTVTAYATGGTPTGSVTISGAPTLLGSAFVPGSKVDVMLSASSVGHPVTGGTSSVPLMAANSSRHGFSVQVQGTSGDCYIGFGPTATTDNNSIFVGSGGYYESSIGHVEVTALSVICTASNVPIFSREW